MRRLGCAAGLALLAVVGAWGYRASRQPPLPAGLTGSVVFVSDRTGTSDLYLRPLPAGPDLRLTSFPEIVRDPSVSPDAGHAAFALEGRIGIVSLVTHDAHFLSYATEWLDAQPSWRPDGRALVISARGSASDRADVHLLLLDPALRLEARQVLTDTPGLDELTPVFAPSADAIVFERTGVIYRKPLPDGEAKRLTSGFRLSHAPRFLSSGRLLVSWEENKQFGLDVMDPDGGNRETLREGTVDYRRVSPSPDGRFLAATFVLDLGFGPGAVLRPWATEEVHLLDHRGKRITTLVGTWRHSNHSADWGR